MFQFGATNLVATVWQDRNPVRVLSTNSDPRIIVQADRRVGHETVQVNQPQCLSLYNRYMNGVDRHDQLRTEYIVGRFAKKAWKYMMWFLVNASIVNAFILWKECSTRRNPKKKYAHLDFHCEVAIALIAGFSSRKRKAASLVYVGPVAPEQMSNHDCVHMGKPNGQRCRWHIMQHRQRKMSVYGCRACNLHFCRVGCHYAYHNFLQNQN